MGAEAETTAAGATILPTRGGCPHRQDGVVRGAAAAGPGLDEAAGAGAGPVPGMRRGAADGRRVLAGAVGHRAGLAAEAAVAARYLAAGREVLARRWRGRGGELDLVVRDGAELVFVEVKCSRSFARAAERLSPRQASRLFAAAAEFLAGVPGGQAVPVRFDVALVDGLGRIAVMENALGP